MAIKLIISTKVDKKLILSGFTSQFKELIEDMTRIFPNDVDINTGKTAISLLLKTNPKIFETSLRIPVTRLINGPPVLSSTIETRP